MSQNDLTIANQGFASFRSDLNSALQALGSTNSGTSAPSTTFANQLFYDTTNNILKIRNEDNDAFISLFTLDQANDNIESLTINGAFTCAGFTSTGIDDNADALAITIDSSENFLVTKTATNYQTVGVEAKSTGQLFATADGNNPIVAVRKSSDGKIQTFFKDTTEVGSIGNNSGILYIGSPEGSDAFLGFGNNIIRPVTSAGASRDNAIDLGFTDMRFKDMYLSGGVFLGGTSSAHDLDKYEEGTFDVVIRDATSGGNTGSVTQTNKYVKIGNKVWMQFNLINITTTGMTGGNPLYFTGLPFTPATGSNASGSVLANHIDIDSNVYQINIFQNSGQSYASILQNRDATGSSTLNVSNYDNSTADVFATIMIEV
tara:strand:+ start:283 stop:1404 length:1122 start_codon:yes stop_codon:yes gene_type:complete